ncbi:MAG: serine/threonine protein kinase [Planctomycetaceae bacterium]|nr:serine/threonine protein kinase [Planctomycetaceae bacterium]
MGVSSGTGLPVTWSMDENVAWKTRLPGAGGSSPIVLGDHIYLTSYSGYLVPGESGGSLDDLKRHLVCLRQDDGTILWDKSVKAKLPEKDRIRDHGYAANTPAADAERVYAFFGKSGVIAYDHEGEQIWQADVGSNTSGWGTAASPVLHNELLFINASVESQSLIALDRSTGKEKWRAGGIRQSWNTPVVVKTEAGDEELVLAMQGKVLAFDLDSGEQLWSCDTDIKWYMVPCGVAADGVVYFLGGRSGTAALAVRTGGRGDVTRTHRLWTSSKGSNVTSPVYHDGHLYWMHEQLGIAYCARAETGDVVYEKRMNRAGQVYASTLLADGRLHYLNRSGKMFVVAAKPEFELLSTNELRDGSQFNASPAVTGSRILLRSGKYLYCVGE